MLIDEARRIAESLRSSYGYSPQINLRAAQMLEKLTEEVECLKVQRWISAVNPPKEGGEYIVVVLLPNGMKECRWDVFHTDAGWCEDYEAKVIFWRGFDSLPEPPEA